MPTYDYLCTHCGGEFEIMHRMSEDPRVECEACGEPALKRQIGGGGALIFKGSGFYETDYRRAAQPAKESSETKKDSTKASSGTDS